MAKTLNELADNLKAFLLEIQSDAHNKGNLRPERYNNLSLKINISANPQPHIIIRIGMSEAEYDIKNLEKINGSLGPDNRYVSRWLTKPNVLSAINNCWKIAMENRGRAYDKETRA